MLKCLFRGFMLWLTLSSSSNEEFFAYKTSAYNLHLYEACAYRSSADSLSCDSPPMRLVPTAPLPPPPTHATCLQQGLCLLLLCHHLLLLCHHLPLVQLTFYKAQDPTATLPLPAHMACKVQDSTAALPPPPAPLPPSPAHTTRLQQGP